MINDESDEGWLSLHEASAMLDISPSTLRRWGDQGRIPMKRTLGGHRRFARVAIEQLREPAPTAPLIQAHPMPAWHVDPHKMARQDWHTRLGAQPGTDRMRVLGQRLLGLLVQFVNRREDDDRFLAEARSVGWTYGREGRTSGHSLHDMVQAFVFFRQTFAQFATPLPGINLPTDLTEVALLRERIERFMDAVLIGTIDGYEREE